VALEEAGPGLAVFMICFAIGVPATIVQRVQMGLQQGFTTSLWQAVGSIIGLLSTLLVIYLKGGLPWLVLAMAGSPVVSLMINGVIFFFMQRRDLLPDISFVSRVGMKRILQGGLVFFVLQLAVSIGFSSDNIILARMLGNESVAQYSVVSRLFEGVLMIIGVVFAPLWPAYGEAKARGDQSWIKRTLTRSMIVTLVLAVSGSLLLVVFYKPIFAMWVGTEFVLTFSLVALCSVWMVLKGLGVTYSMFLNGINAIRLQVVIATIFTVVSIIAKIFLASRFGLNGLLAAMICCYALLVVFPYLCLNNRLLAQEAD
jgi:O-antigen/teichoic acid export membrane protein